MKSDLLMKRVRKLCSGKLNGSKGIARIFGVPYNSQHLGAVKVSNRTVSLLQQKTTKEKYNLK